MSYPRNASSPPHFLVGYVYQISDGAVQTAGVSARVKTGTGSWGAAAGTLDCDTTSGAWTYTPTQGETNAEAFSVSLYKANCSGVGITVITGKSSTAGYVAPDWGQVLNPSSTVGLSGTTIKAVTDGVSLGSAVITSGSFASGAITAASIAAAALNGKGDWQTVIWSSASATVNLSGTTVKAVTDSVSATVSDKTGYKLASDGLAAISAWTVAITGNLTGNVTGSVNSVTSTVSANVTQWNSGALPSFPSNFGALLINSSGHVSRVTLVDTTTTNTDMRGTDGAALASVWTSTIAGRIDMPLSDIPTAGENADAVWDEVMSGHTTAGTYGGRIPRSDSSNVEVKLTGSAHIAADIHDLQPAVIEAQHFALGAVDANAVAADASSEIATAVRTELATELARIDVTVGSRLATASYTAPPTATTIADSVLGRNVSNVESTAAEHSICTLVLAALESSVIGTSWTIKRTDGTTTHATKTVTTDASAEPITGVS